MFAIFLLLFFIAVEVLIFSAPARIPTIRQWAFTHRIKRWVVIGVLSLTVTFVNYVAVMWVFSLFDMIESDMNNPYWFCWESDGRCNNIEDSVLGLDSDLWFEFVSEITLRRIFLTGTRHCFSSNDDVCRSTTIWLNMQQERYASYDLRIDYLFLFIFILIFLSPSVLTGYFVYRITRDNRKQKQKLE